MAAQPAPAKKPGARVIFEDESWAQGWTQVPNELVRARGIDPDAKMVLITLMSYAYLPADELPDQAEMARDLNRSARWLWQQLQDLQRRNILVVRRHGQGQANEYMIRKMSEWRLDSQPCAKQDDSQPCAKQDSQPSADGIRNRLRVLSSYKKETTKKETKSGASAPRRAPSPSKRIKTADDPDAPPGRRVALQIARKVLRWTTCKPDWLDLNGEELQRIIDDPDSGFDAQDLIDWAYWLNSGRDAQTGEPYWVGKGYLWNAKRSVDIIWTELNDWNAHGRREEKPDRSQRGPVDVKHLAYVKANGGDL